jgi:hypothetical protein
MTARFLVCGIWRQKAFKDPVAMTEDLRQSILFFCKPPSRSGLRGGRNEQLFANHQLHHARSSCCDSKEDMWAACTRLADS